MTPDESVVEQSDDDHDPDGLWDVIVVGAGPVGLLLAGELAAAGVDTLVLERDESPSPIPKANGVVGHSAVELAKRGVLAGTGLQVRTPPRFQFGPLPLKLGFGPGNPLHVLPVPQRRLEDLLEHRAVEHGAQLRRGDEVVDFSQDNAGVTLAVQRHETSTRLRARYLVGCDGARSFVRKHAGIDFPGFTSDRISRIARVTIPADRIRRTSGDGVEIDGVGGLSTMRPNPRPGGTFTIAPVAALDPRAPADLYLVSTHEPANGTEPDDDLPVEEFRASVRRVLGAELAFTDATAVRSTIGNSRQAATYRLGRVFLAGDAAHIFNAGGSSLNIGLQDAFELAPRLVAAVRNPGSRTDSEIEAELDGYHAVRQPAGRLALEHTRVQAMLGSDDEDSLALRSVLTALLSKRSAARALAQLIENS